MYLEHFHLNKSPFPEKPDLKVFFPKADRGKTLRSLLSDINAHKSLIKLIGTEGSGKTLLCKLLISQISKDFDVVYLENPLGSFDDLLRIICLDLGMDPATDNKADIIEELNNQLVLREKEKRSIVIIIDEAEKLFLATLERLIRVLCDNEAKGILQVLLTGRPGLNTNLNQLSIYCSNVDIHAGYFLEPLTLEETGSYLNYRLKASGLLEKEKNDIFTDGAIQKIYETAKGNLRLTNILAEESLQNSCTEKSFLVLLEHVSSKPDEENGRRKQISQPKNVSPLKIFKNVQYSTGIDFGTARNLFFKYKRQIGGFFCVLVALLLIMILSGEHKPVPVESESISDKRPTKFEYIEELAKDDLKKPPTVQANSSIAERNEDSQPLVGLENNGEKFDIGEDVTENTSTDSEPRDADKIYEERLRSSASWLAGTYREATTIQLMKLTSQQGEENIKKMLVMDEYFSIKDNLFILRKKTSPLTIFVFYGSFESLDAARDYRNNMPLFLRKHHPYALTITDALKKIED
jgi:type II secretory pathway predicted ATPase ExeA